MKPSTPTTPKVDNLRFPSPSNFLDFQPLPINTNRSGIVRSPSKHKS